MVNQLKKGNIRITLSVNKEIYDRYKGFCKKEGFVMSKQVEKFMKTQMRKGKDRNVLEHLLGK